MELAIVCGAALAAIFVVIPAQTLPGDEIGLSPGLVPTACAAAIAILSLIHFGAGLLRRGRGETRRQVPIRHAAILMASVAVGIGAIPLIGLTAASALLALLVSVALGERRVPRLALVTGGVALVLFGITWAGF